MVNSIPADGSTWKEPGSGGPLVVTIIAEEASWHVSERRNRDRTGRPDPAITKFTVAVDAAITSTVSGVVATADRTKLESSTSQRAVHGTIDSTDAWITSRWLASTASKELEGVVIVIIGASAPSTVTTAEAALDLEPLATWRVSFNGELTALVRG